jgi:hypothetical protein
VRIDDEAAALAADIYSEVALGMSLTIMAEEFSD